MDDLISRNDVIQILKECNLDETLFEKDVFDKILNLPTAHNVDKVVRTSSRNRSYGWTCGRNQDSKDRRKCK